MLTEQQLQAALDAAVENNDEVAEKLAFNALVMYRLALDYNDDEWGGMSDRQRIRYSDCSQSLFLSCLAGSLMRWLEENPHYIQRLDEDTLSLLPDSFLGGSEAGGPSPGA